MTEDARRARGQATRARVLAHAGDVASMHGLDGLSLSGIAAETSVSKSNVHSLFGSKQELQLATIAAARERFVAAVVEPALAARPGTLRLRALVDGWLAYLRDGVFPGGCFVTHCLAEHGARPGPVRDALVACKNEWLALLTREFASVRDPAQAAFELDALLVAAHDGLAAGRPDALDRARRAAVRLVG